MREISNDVCLQIQYVYQRVKGGKLIDQQKDIPSRSTGGIEIMKRCVQLSAKITKKANFMKEI